MRKLFTLCLVFIPSLLLSQFKDSLFYVQGSDTSHVPFMYLFGDTLDYADGGSMRTKVEITSIMKDKNEDSYVISGILSERPGGELYGDFGIVTTGKIEMIIAKTWLGEMETGRLVRDSKIIHTKKGKFNIVVSQDYANSVIFAAEGGGIVIDIPFKELLGQYYKK